MSPPKANTSHRSVEPKCTNMQITITLLSHLMGHPQGASQSVKHIHLHGRIVMCCQFYQDCGFRVWEAPFYWAHLLTDTLTPAPLRLWKLPFALKGQLECHHLWEASPRPFAVQPFFLWGPSDSGPGEVCSKFCCYLAVTHLPSDHKSKWFS